jgi:hypothetical protein
LVYMVSQPARCRFPSCWTGEPEGSNLGQFQGCLYGIRYGINDN